MRKEVSNFWRYSHVGHGANHRLFDALANAHLKGAAIETLDRLCGRGETAHPPRQPSHRQIARPPFD